MNKNDLASYIADTLQRRIDSDDDTEEEIEVGRAVVNTIPVTVDDKRFLIQVKDGAK